MNNLKNKSEAKILRLKAEGLVKKTKNKLPVNFNVADSLKLIHELEVHQIELELQHQELFLAKEQLALNANEQYDELYNFAPSANFSLSKAGNILKLNQNSATLLGMERQQLTNSLFNRFLSPQSQPIFKSFLDKILTLNTKETCELTLAGQTENSTFVHLTGILTKNGEHFLISILDTTERNLFVKQLIKLKEHAEESDRLKSAFLANMSHEIRTPLNSIMGFASLLPDEESITLTSKYSQIILSSSEQLLHMIDDIVLYSSLQSKLLSLHPTVIDLTHLLNEIKESFNFPRLQENVKLIIETRAENPLRITSDYEKLKQIFTNLISNAYKYTKQGSIRVGFSSANKQLTFYIKDTGMGILPNDLNRVFERFYRGSNVTKGVIGGTGLGLSIVKELIELLGGKIWVESEVELGTTFYFTIPITCNLPS
ncbi:MAG: ATP-binding protein [Prolixibacteraceae bacterium]